MQQIIICDKALISCIRNMLRLQLTTAHHCKGWTMVYNVTFFEAYLLYKLVCGPLFATECSVILIIKYTDIGLSVWISFMALDSDQIYTIYLLAVCCE